MHSVQILCVRVLIFDARFSLQVDENGQIRYWPDVIAKNRGFPHPAVMMSTAGDELSKGGQACVSLTIDDRPLTPKTYVGPKDRQPLTDMRVHDPFDESEDDKEVVESGYVEPLGEHQGFKERRGTPMRINQAYLGMLILGFRSHHHH
jgi:hypothetical protein